MLGCNLVEKWQAASYDMLNPAALLSVRRSGNLLWQPVRRDYEVSCLRAVADRRPQMAYLLRYTELIGAERSEADQRLRLSVGTKELIQWIFPSAS